jgi:hypothetical protein
MDKRLEAMEDEIGDIARTYHEIITAHEAAIEAARQECDAKIQAKQQERDALALTIKLKGFPKKLVTEHTTCSFCGELMRPFQTVDGDGNPRKIWACQNGSLSVKHDLVIVQDSNDIADQTTALS